MAAVTDIHFLVLNSEVWILKVRLRYIKKKCAAHFIISLWSG